MLKLSKGSVIGVLQWAERHPDVEVTGFVAEGAAGQRVQPMKNISPYPDRYYDWDPVEMMERFNELDAQDERPIAYYHSHPGGSSEPSETDMLGALNIGMHYVIAYPWRRSQHEPVLPGEPNEAIWRLSVWECIDMGILIESSYEVVG